MIGNSHIDPVWLWRDREGFQAVKSTFASALERMKEFPEFKMSASFASYYEWIEDNLPEMFEEIKKRVKEGRWEIVGGWYVEPDCDIPSGESFVRQGLYSQRYYKEKFGKTAVVGYNIDSFGHNGMLPQILKKSGIDYYIFMRPHGEYMQLPSPVFKWRSKDGSEVIGCRIEGEYTAWTKVAVKQNLDAVLVAMDKTGLQDMPCFYGVGNHGGGPTIENIMAVKEVTYNSKDSDIKFSSIEDFFKNVNKDGLPVVEKELQRIFDGCFSVDSEIKKLNRRSENTALKSERLAALSWKITGCTYPGEKIQEMWKLILFNQFHDILAGTSMEQGRCDAIEDFHAACSIGRKIINKSIQSIVNKLDTRGEGFPLIIFNPNAFDVEDMVTAEFYWRVRKPLRLKDQDGQEIVYQETRHEAVAPDSRRRIIFKAKVPPMGFAEFRLLEENPTVKADIMKVNDFVLENQFIKVTFNKEDGKVSSIIDKSTGYEALKGEIGYKVYKDERDTWGAAGSSDELLGEFTLVRMAIEEEGANRSTVRVMMEHEGSTLIQYYYLNRDADYIVVKNRLFSKEKFKMVKLCIPVNVKDICVRGEIPYGFEDREYCSGEEIFAHSYCRIFDKGDGRGIIAANDSKYGYRMYNNEYQLTVSRSSVYALGKGAPIDEDKEYRFIDQGEIEYTYIIKPHGCAVRNCDAIELASRINLNLDYLCDSAHSGEIPLSSSGYISVDKDDIIVNVVKKCEDDGSLIIRAYETEGESCDCTLKCFDGEYKLSFGPCEIKTVKILSDGLSIVETNMLEMQEEC